MKTGEGAPEGLPLLKGPLSQSTEEKVPSAGLQHPLGTLPSEQTAATPQFCEQACLLSPGQLVEKQNHAVREQGRAGARVPSHTAHHTSRKRELLDLEWNGSDHILRKSPFK